MEGILLKIVSDCGSASKFAALKQVAQDACDILVAQQGNPLSEMHELRDKCLAALEQALEIKGSRFASYGLEGLQLLLRDNQLHSLEGTKENPEESLPLQVLHTLHSLPDWSQESDMQCHCLTVILQVICSPAWAISSDAITAALELCIATFASTKQVSVRMAARATVSQILNSYCTNLYKEQVEDAADADFHEGFDEVIILLEFCIHKFTQMANCMDQNPGLLLVCDACLAILSAQTIGIQSYQGFVNLVWKDLCPNLISLIGNPIDNDGVSASGELAGGRGASGSSGNQAIFGSPDIAKTLYMTCVELLRLVGPVESMRSVMEALFHRFLLYPPPSKRGDALRILKKLSSSPERVVDICALFGTKPSDDSLKNHPDSSPDLSLWKIILDSLVECSQCGEVEVSALAVECVDCLLVSMGQLCQDSAAILQPDFVSDLNARYGTLRSADSESFPYISKEHSKLQMMPSFDSIHSEEGSDSQLDSPTKSSPSIMGQESKENLKTEVKDSPVKTGGNDMELCMKNVANRIGSVLKKYDSHNYEGSAEDRKDHFLKVQSAVSEHQQKMDYLGKKDGQRDVDRARAFIKTLEEKVTEWDRLKSIIELDEAVQNFASEYCKDFMAEEELNVQKSGNTALSFLNADAVYLATFASLKFCHRLNQMRFYIISDAGCPITEANFVAEILRDGCIVYATEAWVKELYNEILRRNILSSLDIEEDTLQGAPLLNMIEDYDGATGDMLRDVQRLEKARFPTAVTMHCSAARKLCRRLFTASWDGFVVVLSSLVEAVRADNRSLVSFLQSLRRKSGSARHRERALLLAEGLSASLAGLQKLAHLCTALKLQTRSGWIFRKLVEVSCPLDELRAVTGRNTHSSGFGKFHQSKQELGGGGSGGNTWTLRVQDALSMEILISSAAETGSHAPDCWKHIIRCFEYVWELERFYFAEKQEKLTKAAKKSAGNQKVRELEAFGEPLSATLESPLGYGAFSPKPFEEDVSSIVTEYQRTKGDILDKALSGRIVCLLITNIDCFFETVSQCLNMKALEEFCDAMITVSQDRLFYSLGGGLVENWSLLHRLTVTLIRSCGSGRPLAHLMRIWTNSAAHFIEASCSPDAAVGKKAVSCLHECVVSILSRRGEELEGFHFNESLLLPFQTILCLEMSDAETQDQIVCILAEFVESYSELIHSGWKPLFGALKAVKASGDIDHSDLTSGQVQRLHRTVLDVLDTFLKMEKWDVFCLAALDCISCLLSYLQAPISLEMSPKETEENLNTEDNSDGLYEAALDSVRRLHRLLASLFTMNRLPVFHLLHRLALRERSVQSVDGNLIRVHLDRIQSLLDCLVERNFFGATGLHQFAWLEHEVEEEELPIPWKGLPVTQLAILESWLTLIEGVVSAVATCPRKLQPDVLQVLNEILESLLLCPGFDFGVFCLVHLVFPMMQQWLRREARFSTGWRENSPSVRNFKQAVGLTSDLTVSYINADPNHKTSERLLQDMCILLTECVAQPSEVVSRLGCSCLRHVILSCAPIFTQANWATVCKVIWKNITVTLHPVRILMRHFLEGSQLRYFGSGENQYYGDLGKVQVALRKDSNPREAQRIKCLAQQVFLLDNQKFVERFEEKPETLSHSCRSVILLLNTNDLEDEESLNPDLRTLRLPFRDIVIALLSHQLLLQLIGSMLLEGTNLVVSGVSSLLMKQVITNSAKIDGDRKKLPGYMSLMKSEHMAALMLCLDASFQVAYDFDERPGLKFLVQKVFNSAVTANLYKQVVTAWTVKALCLFEVGKRSDLNSSQIQSLCKSPEKSSKKPAKGTDSSPNDRGWFEPRKPVEELGDKCLSVVSAAYLTICRELTKIEEDCGHIEADRAAKAIEQEPFVFLLAQDESNKPDASNGVGDGEKYLTEETVNGDSVNHPVQDEIDGGKEDAEPEETVYCVATTETISAVLAEYKKHKQKNTMPPPATIMVPPRQNPFLESQNNSIGDMEDSESEPSMDQEQTESVLKDGEARCLAWAEMSVGTLQLVLALPERDFRRLLPVVYPAAIQLAAGSSQHRVRQSISDMLFTLQETFDFLGSE